MAMQNFPTQIRTLFALLTQLEQLTPQIERVIEICTAQLRQGLPILVCGNGGSAADAQHIAGELVGKFLMDRKALNVRSLSTDTSIITAWANDVSYDTIFARQVEAYGQVGGVLWAISTSGNSKNVLEAAKKAKEMGMIVIGLTGQGGGQLTTHCDVLIAAPSLSTPRIQEMHQMVYHYICENIEMILSQ